MTNEEIRKKLIHFCCYECIENGRSYLDDIGRTHYGCWFYEEEIAPIIDDAINTEELMPHFVKRKITLDFERLVDNTTIDDARAYLAEVEDTYGKGTLMYLIDPWGSSESFLQYDLIYVVKREETEDERMARLKRVALEALTKSIERKRKAIGYDKETRQ